jgi:hypothetical protein
VKGPGKILIFQPTEGQGPPPTGVTTVLHIVSSNQ